MIPQIVDDDINAIFLSENFFVLFTILAEVRNYGEAKLLYLSWTFFVLQELQ